MATSTLGDDVAKWSGWRMFLVAILLIVGTILGSLGAAMGLYGYRYNVLLGAIIFESGMAALHIFCGGRLGRSYYPLHPIIRAQMPRLFTLHIIVLALIVGVGFLVIGFASPPGSWWVAQRGPKHDSPLSIIVGIVLIAITFTEVAIGRQWLQRAVSSQGEGNSAS